MLNMLEILLNRQVSDMLLACAVVCILTTMDYAQASNGGEGIATSTTAQPLPAGMARLQVVQTDSPRDTLRTFLRLTRELENALLSSLKNRSRSNADRVVLIGPQLIQLIDLSSVPKALRREIGKDTLGFLLDIIGRLDLPPIESVPGADAFEDDEAPAKWRIPGSPIWIVRIEDGPRESEFLFSERTITIAPGFYQRIQHLPLRSSIGIASWTEVIPQWHGPMIPSGIVAALPDSLKLTWLGTPIWKIVLVVVLIALGALLLIIGHRVINLPESGNRLVVRLRRLPTPIAMIVVVVILSPVILIEINVAGIFARDQLYRDVGDLSGCCVDILAVSVDVFRVGDPVSEDSRRRFQCQSSASWGAGYRLRGRSGDPCIRDTQTRAPGAWFGGRPGCWRPRSGTRDTTDSGESHQWCDSVHRQARAGR